VEHKDDDEEDESGNEIDVVAALELVRGVEQGPERLSVSAWYRGPRAPSGPFRPTQRTP